MPAPVLPAGAGRNHWCTMHKTLTPNRIIITLITGTFLLRLYFVLSHQGMWGVDGGAYLLSRNAVLGIPRLADFPRPPLAPGYLLVPFTTMLGDDMGLKIFALVASFALVPPFLLLARQSLTPYQTAWALFLLLMDWMLTEMFTAGVLPMVAFGFLLLGMWGVYRLRERWHATGAAAVMVALPGIMYTNQTTVGIAAVTLPAFALGLGLTRPFARRLVLPTAVGIAVAATALPWYFAVMPGSGLLRYPGPLLAVYTYQNSAWFQLALGLAVGIAAYRRGPAFIKGMAAVLLALSVLVPLVSFDESLMNIFYRSRYLHAVPLYICAVWLAVRYAPAAVRWRPILYPGLALLAAVMLTGNILQLSWETKLGRMVTPQTAQAIQWLRTQPTRAVATNSYSLSLYVSALLQRRSPWLQVYDPPLLYRQQHSLMTCLMGWRERCDPRGAAARLGVSHVLVERLWPSYGDDVARRVPGLGKAYGVVEAASPWKDDVLGLIWGAPQHAWEVTARRAWWLHPVWEKGSTIVYEVRF